jgi:hypothetical protein
MVLGKSAEALAHDAQRAVEARAQILEGDNRCQFDDLRDIKVLLEVFETRVRNLRGCMRHPFRVAQDRLFARVKERARLEVGQLSKLLISDALCSAHGRVDIHSKSAAGDLCGAHAGKGLEPGLDHT